MTICNGASLLAAAPLDPMLDRKMRAHGVSFGLTEAGADIRIRQDVRFVPPDFFEFWSLMCHWEKADHLRAAPVEIAEAFHGYVEVDGVRTVGRFCLASSVERFTMPDNLVSVIAHKSTHARRGVDVWAGTVAESGWSGHLTIEIAFHGTEPVHIPAGSGIAQVLFHRLENPASYEGRYNNQPDRPVPAIPATEGTPL